MVLILYIRVYFLKTWLLSLSINSNAAVLRQVMCEHQLMFKYKCRIIMKKMDFSLRRIMHYQKKLTYTDKLARSVVSFVIRKKLASCLRPLPFLARKNTGCAKIQCGSWYPFFHINGLIELQWFVDFKRYIRW